MGDALFYVFGALMVLFTFLTIRARNPVYSAIFMILSFASTAALFVMLDAFLLAAVEVLVYAGAIMVLFLFVIMLINLRAAEHDGLRVSPLVVLVALTFLLLLGRGIADLGPVPAGANELVGTPQLVAKTLFTRYVVPFEAVSILLLSAILGTVVLARRSGEA